MRHALSVRAAWLALGIALAIGGLAWADRLRVDRGVRETSERQLAVLEGLGGIRARRAAKDAEARAREFASVIPSLQRDLDEALAATAPARIVAVTEASSGAPVWVPCGPMSPSPAGSPETGLPAGEPATVSVEQHVRIEDATFFVDNGELVWRGRIFGWLTTSTWTSPEQELTITRHDARVDPDLERAWAAWRDRPARVACGIRGPRHWRAGWVVGLGWSYDPFRGRIAPAVFVGYGAQL